MVVTTMFSDWSEIHLPRLGTVTVTCLSGPISSNAGFFSSTQAGLKSYLSVWNVFFELGFVNDSPNFNSRTPVVKLIEPIFFGCIRAFDLEIEPNFDRYLLVTIASGYSNTRIMLLPIKLFAELSDLYFLAAKSHDGLKVQVRIGCCR